MTTHKGFTALTDKQKDDWMKEKNALVLADAKRSFSANILLSDIGIVVNRKLEKLRAKMLLEDPVIHTGRYYEKLPKLLASDLFKCFRFMPKMAIHHTHLTACTDLSFLVSLTYNDFVYYSEKDDLFVVNKNGCDKPNYLPVNQLREYS